MTPDKMTNAELAKILRGATASHMCTSDFALEVSAAIPEAIKRLRAMPEPPKPEWSDWMGWNGGAQPVADEAIVSVSFNSAGHREDSMAGDIEWRHDGCDDVVSYRVMANTPEPEIYWRRPSKPDQMYYGVGAHDRLSGNFEKVEVRVIK